MPRMFIKGSRVTAMALALVAGLGWSSAYAQTLQVRVQAGASTVTVQDNGVGDTNSNLGFVTFVGPVGSYSVLVTVAQSKPGIGDPTLAHVDLFVSAIQGGSDLLTVKLTDTDFVGPISGSATMTAVVGGNTDRPLKTSFQAYVDASNTPFGTAGPDVCSPGPQSINTTATATCALHGNFSMTAAATTQLSAGQRIGFDFDVKLPLPVCGAVGDFVWHDQNRDGLQDVGEPGIDGVKLTLKDTSDNPLATTFTGINPNDQVSHGYYQFPNVCAGSYKVELDNSTVPAGFFPTLVEVGADRTIDSNANPTFTTLLVDGDSDQTLDFGFQSPCDGSIGNFVWYDVDEDGIQDAGELGIPGVMLTLNPGNHTTFTDANGLYLFTGLCPGVYEVQVTPPAGYTASPTLVGSDDTIDSNPNPETVTLTNNEHNLTIDFGFFIQRPPQLKLEKSPKNGTFTTGSQVSFTIVVSNPALPGAGTAQNVHLTDALPGNGGLVWETATTTQGSCVSPIIGNTVNCALGDLAPGDSVVVTVSSTATTPFEACQAQPNPVALATADGGLSAQDSGSLTCTPPPPRLSVEKSPKNGTFTIGSQVSFTIVVSNPAPPGSSAAENVHLTDALPGNGGLAWQTATASQGSCTIVANNLSCALGTIAAGGSVTVTVTSTATTPVEACQAQPNPVALATADGGLQAQDSGSLTCTPPPPQLRVVKTPDNGTFTSGAQVSFTIVVSNPAPAGSSPATNVQLTDALPGNGGLVWQTATTTQGSCVSPIVGNTLSCALGTINAGASVTVTVTSTATTPFEACQAQPNPIALATADGGLQAQDAGSLTCTPPPPQLKVVKTPKNGTFTAGSQATFTIVVSNPAPAGSSPATNVQLTDALPGNGGLVWQTATTTQGSCVSPIVGNTLNCSLGTINPGASVTVTIKTTTTTPISACQSQPNPLALATANGGLQAQDSGSLTCNPGYATYTIGGWGAPPNGNNIASKLAANFATIYPTGVVVGGNKKAKFTKASAIEAYLPDGTTPGVLTATVTNPLTTPAGVFGSQVLALRLNVDFSNAGILKPGLANLTITPGHPLAGLSVLQVLAIANAVLGGDLTKLPAGMSVSTLNNVVDALNNNFHEGGNNGWLQ